MNAQDAALATHDPSAPVDATPDPTEALRPTVAPVGPHAVFLDVWMGRERWRCTLRDYDGISEGAVERHIAVSHPKPSALTVEERTARLGIIIANR